MATAARRVWSEPINDLRQLSEVANKVFGLTLMSGPPSPTIAKKDGSHLPADPSRGFSTSLTPAPQRVSRWPSPSTSPSSHLLLPASTSGDRLA